MHEKYPFFINMPIITSETTIIPATTSAPITTPTVQGGTQLELLEDTVLVGVLDSITNNNNNNNNNNFHIVLISDEQGLIIIVEGEY